MRALDPEGGERLFEIVDEGRDALAALDGRR
jgi:hypothetical protein